MGRKGVKRREAEKCQEAKEFSSIRATQVNKLEIKFIGNDVPLLLLLLLLLLGLSFFFFLGNIQLDCLHNLSHDFF